MKYKQYKPITPSRRFFTSITYFDICKQIHFRFFNKCSLIRHYLDTKSQKLRRGLRKVTKFPYLYTMQNIFFRMQYACLGYLYAKKSRKEFSILKNIFNFYLLYPGLSSLYPGLYFIVKPQYSWPAELKYFINTLLPLFRIPFGLNVCYLQNKRAFKYTYAMSSGTFCIKLKATKKTKLCLVLLPSQQQKYISKNITCILGQVASNFSEKFNYGKYGSYLKKNFISSARGVAQNPVDHPNGGRTKSKNPQLSPWGWVAKKTR